MLITAPKARRDILGGVSDMCLYRWMRDPALHFPEPIIINTRRYFDIDQLKAWVSSRDTAQTKPQGGNTK